MESWIKSVAAFFGAATSYFYGGWPILLQVLLVFVVIDWLTGIIAGYRDGVLSSKVGSIGILRKVMIFAIVSIGHLSDIVLIDLLGETVLSFDGHPIRDAAILFYLANEALSILENCGRMGLPVPPAIRKAIEIFSEKSEHEKESE